MTAIVESADSEPAVCQPLNEIPVPSGVLTNTVNENNDSARIPGRKPGLLEKAEIAMTPNRSFGVRCLTVRRDVHLTQSGAGNGTRNILGDR